MSMSTSKPKTIAIKARGSEVKKPKVSVSRSSKVSARRVARAAVEEVVQEEAVALVSTTPAELAAIVPTKPRRSPLDLAKARAALVKNLAVREGKKSLHRAMEIRDGIVKVVHPETGEAQYVMVKPETMLSASLAIIERGLGKAPQEVQHTGKDGGDMKMIVELPSNNRSTPPAPRQITVESSKPVATLIATDAEYVETELEDPLN